MNSPATHPKKRASRALTAVLLAVAIGVGGGVTAAHAADSGTIPSGCSIAPTAPYTSNAYIRFGGSGYCNAAGINSFAARLIHNYDGLPDVRVSTVQNYNKPNYSASGSTCDNGGTAQYYTEAGFYRPASYGGDVIRTSATRTLNHC